MKANIFLQIWHPSGGAMLPILIGIIPVFFMVRAINAQESDMLQKPQEYNFIVDEALDEAEESIDKTMDDALPMKPVDSQALELEPNAGTPEEVEVLEEIIIEADTESVETPETPQSPKLIESQETKIIPLLHAEASSIIEALDQMKSPAGEVTYGEEDRTLTLKDEPQYLQAMSAFVKTVDILLETEIFELEHVKAQDIAENVETALTQSVGQVQLDEQTNSIIATDTPLKIGEIKAMIAKLDRINKEIQIEAKILQIVLNDEHLMGVDWEAIVSDYQNVMFPSFTFKTDLQKDGQLNLGVVSQEDYTILLEALDTVGAVGTVFNNMTIMENGDTKSINVLSSLLREMQKDVPDLDVSGDIVNADHLDTTSEGEKVQFRLTPTIGGDGLVAVLIQPEFFDENTGRLEKISKLRAIMQVEDGATIVIGSLFDEVMVESTWKIPLLGDLPLLGFVFRNQGEVPRKAEIITFLTVKVIEKEK